MASSEEVEFNEAVARDVAIPVAAIQVLLGVIRRSSAATMHGLDEELHVARDRLVRYCEEHSTALQGRTSISLSSGCELFMRHVTRTFLEFEDFERCKDELLTRGQRFERQSLVSRDGIASVGHPFIRDGATVLVHGRSRVVLALLLKAAETKRFKVTVTDAGGAGPPAAKQLSDAGVPVNLIQDAAIAYFMEQVDCVLVGAEGVTENGGIINKVGTLLVATCANAFATPFYVAVESYKFARIYPLKQRDLPNNFPRDNSGGPICDYTPPNYITLLFTDLGVLTPSAVSDELIRLYQ